MCVKIKGNMAMKRLQASSNKGLNLSVIVISSGSPDRCRRNMSRKIVSKMIYTSALVRSIEMDDKDEYLERLIEAHERSGLSLREVVWACDLDLTDIIKILKGACRPRRDVIIALGYSYLLDRIEMDEILILAGMPPLGRSIPRQFQKA